MCCLCLKKETKTAIEEKRWKREEEKKRVRTWYKKDRLY